MKPQILIWDNDGTVIGSNNPNDTAIDAKIILPGVEVMMRTADFNFIVSGIKSLESEMQNFDPEKVIIKFINLMEKLPINAVAFSPLIDGVACYVIIKRPDNTVLVKKAHEEPRYKEFIGHFKKPGIGMFVVIKDTAKEEFNHVIDKSNSIMIGDSWQDEQAAKNFEIPFMHASRVHTFQKVNSEISSDNLKQ